MVFPALPNPKHELTRYNSQQLLIWLEDSQLRRLLFFQEMNSAKEPIKAICGNAAMRAAEMTYNLLSVLEERGYGAEAHMSLNAIEQDVNANVD